MKVPSLPASRSLSLCLLLAAVCAAAILIACGETDKSNWTDAQLHLSEQQSAGRRVFRENCSICHAAYTSKKLNGPSLKGLYGKRALPSGAALSDERVQHTIERGQKMMPGFAGLLSQQELDSLLAYLRTL